MIAKDAPPAHHRPSEDAASSRFGRGVNTSAAVALVLLAFLSFSHVNAIWDPGYYGAFGFDTGQGSLTGETVGSIVPGSAADQAGLRSGDVMQRPGALRSRLLALGFAEPRPGERLALTVTRGREQHPLLLRAQPVAALATSDKVLLVAQYLLSFGFAAIGLTLVLMRPSRMTWGFFLFGLTIAIFYGDFSYFSRLPDAWLVALILASDVVVMAGVAGLLVFCARFPNDRPDGWRLGVDRLATYSYIALPALYVFRDLVAMNFAAPALIARLGDALHLVILANLLVGGALLLNTYRQARGLERYRIQWVVVGVAFAFAAAITNDLWAAHLFALPDSLLAMLPFFYIVLPITVAYAIIRHRIIDLHFVLSRTIAFGVIAALVALLVVGVDWFFSNNLPASRLQGAAYAGLALIIGFSLNAARERILKTIDSILFRHWHQAQQQVDVIAGDLRQANVIADVHAPLTTGVANTFRLASAALFERVEDGGFLRASAVGWPIGTLWHILPHDPLVELTKARRDIVDLYRLQWPEGQLPAGVGRPDLMLPIFAGKRLAAILLYGAHDNGTGLDPDELRLIRRLVQDAGVVYFGLLRDRDQFRPVAARVASASV